MRPIDGLLYVMSEMSQNRTRICSCLCGLEKSKLTFTATKLRNLPNRQTWASLKPP